MFITKETQDFVLELLRDHLIRVADDGSIQRRRLRGKKEWVTLKTFTQRGSAHPYVQILGYRGAQRAVRVDFVQKIAETGTYLDEKDYPTHSDKMKSFHATKDEHANQKLTDDDVFMIRWQHTSQKRKVRTLAIEYGVTPAYIRRILDNEARTK